MTSRRARGTVSTPGESRYDEAVNIWNGAIRRRPAVVAGCATSGDVAAALAFARSAGLEVSVRGGGHNFAGFALTEGGLMIDLTPMKAITVDPGRGAPAAVAAPRGPSWTRPRRSTHSRCPVAS